MKSPAMVALLAQLGFSLVAGALLLLVSSLVAYSYVLGSLVYTLPNAYFALYAFRYRGARSTDRILKSFHWGESGKFALVLVGFALVFRLVSPLHAPALFAGFCSMIVFQVWLARIITQRWLSRKKH